MQVSVSAAGRMLVQFTCERCKQLSIRQQNPGFLPRYCKPCAGIVKREKTALRTAAYRQRQEAVGG
jgi:hypothetical protein